MARLVIHLDEDERKALGVLAEQERRDFREQAALLIRQALEREGVLRERVIKPSGRENGPDGKRLEPVLG